MTPQQTCTESTMGRLRIPSAVQTLYALLAVLVGIAACGDDPMAPSSCGSLPPVTINVGETATVTACFDDVDMLTYSVISSNRSVATASASGPLITVSAIAPGNATITVTAQDPGGLSGQQNFPVMVPNRAPLPQGSIPTAEIVVGETETVDASSYFTEPDGEALTYGADSSDPSVVTVSVAGANVTVTAIARGTSNVTVTARDPGGLSATQTFQAAVPNQAPRGVGTIPARTVQVGDPATFDVSQYFDDPDGDPLTYTATSSSSGVATVSTAGANLTVTAVAKGTSNVTVTATDPGGLNATQTFEITVPNRPPAATGTIPAQTITEGREATVNVSSYFTDPDGDALTYSASSSNMGVARVSVEGSVVTISAVAVGSATVTVTARDSGGLTATQTASVTVNRANRAPQRRGTIPAQTITEGRTATVNVSSYFTDPDGDALTYSASSSNMGVARVSVEGSVVTISAVAVGSATVTVTARDSGGLTATQTASVTVNRANRAPQRQGTIPAQTITEGRTATVNVSSYFTDPDGDALTYSATSSNTGVAQVSVAGSMVTISAVAVGSATVTVTARDSGGLTATQTASVTVNRANQAPQPVGSVPAQTLNSGGTGTLDASRYFSDPDGDALTYSATSSNTGVASVSVSGSTVTITAAGVGSATVTVTARDPGGLTATQTASVTVRQATAPNLVFASVSPRTATATVPPADTVDVDVVIRNAGNADAAATNIRFLQSNDSTITRNDQEIGSPSSLRALRASEEFRGDWSVIIPANFPTPRTIYVGWCVDSVPGESNTEDNCSPSVQITVTAAGSATRLTSHPGADWGVIRSPVSVPFPILFVSDRDGDSDIFAMRDDGSGVKNLTFHAGFDSDPAWSPDGTRIAFVSDRDGNGNDEIHVMNRDGSGETRVTLQVDSSNSQRQPAWSPDGRLIAFEADSDSSQYSDIFVMNADGSGIRNLTNSDESNDGQPAWSPNGQQIAFVSDRDGGTRIYVMNADGSGVTPRGPDMIRIRLSPHLIRIHDVFEPAWSPDGGRIAFTAGTPSLRNEQYRELFVMNADGGGVTQLTDNDSHDGNPAWTPDGRILFNSDRDGNLDIYVMSVSSPGQQQASEVARDGSGATISVVRRR